ncbi:MAG: tetratricopeptide repeat protein [Gammaproteobacteria bacterium]|nr:tetratricopeptide repeat protein [Gammaproteobacteria bacterium]
MVDENLTDEQQAEIVRNWLRENGTFIFGGIGLGLLALFGWNQWQDFEVGEAESAAVLYESIVAELPAGDPQMTVALLEQLQAEHEGSPYLDQARFILAKNALDQNDFEVAATYLEAVADGGSSSESALIAKSRLARVRLHLGMHDSALEALEGVDQSSSFAARFSEIRGDVYLAMGRPDDARAEYDLALADAHQPPVIDRAYVQAKRDSLGEPESAQVAAEVAD